MRAAAGSPTRATWLGWLTAALVLAAWAGPAGPAPARGGEAAAGSCDGVWVVVDAREVGGSITTRCAAGDPDSGLAALTAAGHAYEFVPRVPGMVCTIDDRPDPCNGAPADAYWSYWHAEEGGSWTYASRGAGERDPDPGEVEGWAFGAGDPPGTSPPEPGPGASAEDAPSDDGSDDGSSDSPTGEGTDTDGADAGSGNDSSGEGASDNDSSSGGSSGDGSSGGSTSAGDPAGESSTSPQEQTGAGAAGSDGAGPGAGPAGEEGSDDRAADEERERTANADDGGDGATAGEDDGERREDAGQDEHDPTGSPGNQGPAGERDDAVALTTPADGAGGGGAGVALGTALAGALAAGAAWQVRRRRLGA